MLATTWKFQRIETAKLEANSGSAGLIYVNHTPPGPTIPRLIPTPNDERLSNFDKTLIHSMPAREFLFGLGNFRLYPSTGPRHRLWDCVLRRYGRNLSSPPVRYGCLLYALFKNGHAKLRDHVHLNFLDVYYRSMQEAISHDAFADLVYGCYAGCMYILRASPNVSEVMHHLTGYRLSACRLISTSVVAEEELVLLECMWEKLLWYMAQELLFKQRVTQGEWSSMMDVLYLWEGNL